MPARSIASASISFGLVSVPVEVYSTGESAASVAFHMLHKDCGTRLKQQYICPKDDVVVDRENTVKGYEFSKSQYVVFTPDEIKALDQKATNCIEITEFVLLAHVDRICLENAYYRGPGMAADRTHQPPPQAPAQSGRAPLAQSAARGRQKPGLACPPDGV